MKRKVISIFLIFSFISVLSGCATVPEEHKGKAIGAGVGAAAGAVLGQVLGKSTEATVIGGLAGALIGGMIGHYAYDTQRTRVETAQVYKYKASHGTMLTLEDVSLPSQSVRPGDVVEIKMIYAVLNPSPGTKTAITEIREITFEGQLVGKPKARVERADGTYTSTVPIRLPATAKKGLYRIKATIESENQKDTKELNFTVS